MAPITAKFGGSSLADAPRFLEVARIITSRMPSPKYVVVSAPGRRSPGDDKVTDLLIRAAHVSGERKSLLAQVERRFMKLIHELAIETSLDLRDIFREMRAYDCQGHHPDWLISRGEYLSARVLAAILGWKFVDATQFIRFTQAGCYDPAATRHAFLAHPIPIRSVIPGFYGATPDGSVRTFSRGGSDITGSIVAALTYSERYENWTDVPGVLSADPSIVPDAWTTDRMTYRELRELAYRGASVLHEESVFPVRKSGVPINVRSARDWAHPGTLIVPDGTPLNRAPGSIAGIAGKMGFCSITLDKPGMNPDIGFLARACSVFQKLGINVEHVPGTIDTLSFIVEAAQLKGKMGALREQLIRACKPASIQVEQGIALICVVGESMVHHAGTSGRIFSALGNAGISVPIIDQGACEYSIVLGVKHGDYENAVRTIHAAFKKRH